MAERGLSFNFNNLYARPGRLYAGHCGRSFPQGDLMFIAERILVARRSRANPRSSKARMQSGVESAAACLQIYLGRGR